MYITRRRVGVIGAGRLGSAILQGLLTAGLKPWAAVRSLQSREAVASDLGIEVTTDFTSMLDETDVVIVAVKPKDVGAVCAQLADCDLSDQTIVISVAAGVTANSLENSLGGRFRVIRAMPNTACRVQSGMTVLVRGSSVSDEDFEIAKELFGTVGECVELTEDLMDAATVVSACGPAFALLILEAFTDAAVNVGLTRSVAAQLVHRCFSGTVQMLATTGQHTALLRDEITTPAGCTISGVMELERGNIRYVVSQAVATATQKAVSLGSLTSA